MNQETLQNVGVATQMRAPHATRVIDVREGAFDPFAALAHQAASAWPPYPTAIAIYGRLGPGRVRPIPSPPVRLGHVRPDAHGVQVDQGLIAVVPLFLFSALLWVLGRTLDASPPPRTWVGVGAILGALALTRENALVLSVALVLWMWSQHQEVWRRTVLLGVGVLIVLAPVALRNGVVGGEWHLTTSQFGPNFYIGNHGEADGTYRPLRFGRGDALFERDDATALAEAAVGRELTPAAVSRYWVTRALTDIVAEPGRWFWLLGRKMALTVNAVEVADTESQYAHAEHSWPLMLTGWFSHFGVLVPLV